MTVVLPVRQAMSITVQLPVPEALFTLAALERHSADAHRSARRILEAGSGRLSQGELDCLDIATATARSCDRTAERIREALYPELRDSEPGIEAGAVGLAPA